MRTIIPVEIEANNPKMLIDRYMKYVCDNDLPVETVSSIRNRIKSIAVHEDMELKVKKTKALEQLEEILKYMRTSDKKIVVFADVLENEIVELFNISRRIIMLKLHNIYLIDVIKASDLPVKAMKEPSLKAMFFTSSFEAYKTYDDILRKIRLGDFI